MCLSKPHISCAVYRQQPSEQASNALLVSVPDPNQPQHGSLSVPRVILEAIYVLDDRSGNETMSIQWHNNVWRRYFDLGGDRRRLLSRCMILGDGT